MSSISLPTDSAFALLSEDNVGIIAPARTKTFVVRLDTSFAGQFSAVIEVSQENVLRLQLLNCT